MEKLLRVEEVKIATGSYQRSARILVRRRHWQGCRAGSNLRQEGQSSQVGPVDPTFYIVPWNAVIHGSHEKDKIAAAERGLNPLKKQKALCPNIVGQLIFEVVKMAMNVEMVIKI